MKTKLTLDGKMKIWSQEGGYAPPDVVVNGESITSPIVDFIGREHVDSNKMVPGLWRITIERIDK